MSNTTTSILQMPEPEWEVARLFPARGAWTEEEYLDLDTAADAVFAAATA